ncbi:beta strand repeat-containing protein [Sinorhizobium fredii]|uniref:beta strand repeat-containing protein n=1 Tax=Rhizobium fredii TaxID=380 RepID=UPI003516FB02
MVVDAYSTDNTDINGQEVFNPGAGGWQPNGHQRAQDPDDGSNAARVDGNPADSTDDDAERTDQIGTANGRNGASAGDAAKRGKPDETASAPDNLTASEPAKIGGRVVPMPEPRPAPPTTAGEPRDGADEANVGSQRNLRGAAQTPESTNPETAPLKSGGAIEPGNTDAAAQSQQGSSDIDRASEQADSKPNGSGRGGNSGPDLGPSLSELDWNGTQTLAALRHLSEIALAGQRRIEGSSSLGRRGWQSQDGEVQRFGDAPGGISGDFPNELAAGGHTGDQSSEAQGETNDSNANESDGVVATGGQGSSVDAVRGGDRSKVDVSPTTSNGVGNQPLEDNKNAGAGGNSASGSSGGNSSAGQIGAGAPADSGQSNGSVTSLGGSGNGHSSSGLNGQGDQGSTSVGNGPGGSGNGSESGNLSLSAGGVLGTGNVGSGESDGGNQGDGAGFGSGQSGSPGAGDNVAGSAIGNTGSGAGGSSGSASAGGDSSAGQGGASAPADSGQSNGSVTSLNGSGNGHSGSGLNGQGDQGNTGTGDTFAGSNHSQSQGGAVGTGNIGSGETGSGDGADFGNGQSRGTATADNVGVSAPGNSGSDAEGNSGPGNSGGNSSAGQIGAGAPADSGQSNGSVTSLGGSGNGHSSSGLNGQGDQGSTSVGNGPGGSGNGSESGNLSLSAGGVLGTGNVGSGESDGGNQGDGAGFGSGRSGSPGAGDNVGSGAPGNNGSGAVGSTGSGNSGGDSSAGQGGRGAPAANGHSNGSVASLGGSNDGPSGTGQNGNIGANNGGDNNNLGLGSGGTLGTGDVGPGGAGSGNPGDGADFGSGRSGSAGGGDNVGSGSPGNNGSGAVGSTGPGNSGGDSSAGQGGTGAPAISDQSNGSVASLDAGGSSDTGTPDASNMAVNFSVPAQSPEPGWQYTPDSETSETSVSFENAPSSVSGYTDDKGAPEGGQAASGEIGSDDADPTGVNGQSGDVPTTSQASGDDTGAPITGELEDPTEDPPVAPPPVEPTTPAPTQSASSQPSGAAVDMADDNQPLTNDTGVSFENAPPSVDGHTDDQGAPEGGQRLGGKIGSHDDGPTEVGGQSGDVPSGASAPSIDFDIGENVTSNTPDGAMSGNAPESETLPSIPQNQPAMAPDGTDSTSASAPGALIGGETVGASDAPSQSTGDDTGAPITGELEDPTEDPPAAPPPVEPTTPAPTQSASSRPSGAAVDMADDNQPLTDGELHAVLGVLKNPDQALSDLVDVKTGRAKQEDFSGERAEELQVMMSMDRRSGGLDRFAEEGIAKYDSVLAEMDAMAAELHKENDSNFLAAKVLGGALATFYAGEAAVKFSAAAGNPTAIVAEKTLSASQELTEAVMAGSKTLLAHGAGVTPTADPSVVPDRSSVTAQSPAEHSTEADAASNLPLHDNSSDQLGGRPQGVAPTGGSTAGARRIEPSKPVAPPSNNAQSVTNIPAKVNELYEVADTSRKYSETGDVNDLNPPEDKSAPVSGREVVGKGTDLVSKAGKMLDRNADYQKALASGDPAAIAAARSAAIQSGAQLGKASFEAGRRIRAWKNGKAVTPDNKLTKVFDLVDRGSSVYRANGAWEEWRDAKTPEQQHKALTTLWEQTGNILGGQKGADAGKAYGEAVVSAKQMRQAMANGDPTEVLINGSEAASKMFGGSAALMVPGRGKYSVATMGGGFQSMANYGKMMKGLTEASRLQRQFDQTLKFEAQRLSIYNKKGNLLQFHLRHLQLRRLRQRIP